MNKPLRILVADDESHIAYILCFKLQQAGMETLSACDGVEALEIATAEIPDLIISDYQMPEMNGVEMCKALAANPATARIPIILLTARGHRIPASELMNTSLRTLLAKPFSFREIIERITEIFPNAGIVMKIPSVVP